MFKNKHFIVALLIAPILAIIAYFGTDMAVSEKPHAAKQGESYKLAAKSNCRYTSGLCDMENGDVKVQFRSKQLTATQLKLSLKSALPIKGAKLSVVDDKAQTSEPVQMQPSDDSGQQWSISLPKPASADSWLRLVIEANGTLYYGETQTAFIKYETLFTQ